MEQTLLLNATYEPLKVVHWQRAVTLWCQGKVEVISSYDREVRSPSFSFRLPSVIRLLRYIKMRRTIDYVPFSRSLCPLGLSRPPALPPVPSLRRFPAPAAPRPGPQAQQCTGGRS